MKYPTPYHIQADGILAEIAQAEAALLLLDANFGREMETLKKKYEEAVQTQELKISVLDKALNVLAKRHRAAIFDGADRVNLSHGALLWSIEERVRRARGVLERLEALGMTGAVKVAKSVDWDQLEKWPDARLIEVGTERIRKEVFSYDVTGARGK
jgi:phage host-nuclease inhibitor protein Gam